MMKNAVPPETGIREQPALFVFNTCEQFVRTIPGLPRDEDDMDDVDGKSEDHIGDECRYRVRARKREVSGGRTTGLY